MTKIVEITDDGISYLTENEIYALVVEKYTEIDPYINLDASTPDGYMAAWYATTLREAVEAVVESYNSKNPNYARDTQLDIVGSITGSTREDGTPTVINIEVESTATVTEGSTISDGTYDYTVDSDIEIGFTTGTATCTTDGVIDPDVGSVTTIVDTIGGWSSVTNTSTETLGTDEQTNSSFRVSRNASVGRPGNNQVDSTIGEIWAVDDVLRVAAYENPTGSADYDEDENPHSLPAHSVSYVVYGGDDDDVAKAIYIKKNPGVTLNQVGTGVSVTVTSDVHSSNDKVIKFGRPTTIDMTHVIEVSDPSGNVPAGTIEEEIQTAIIDYVNGDLLSTEDGFDEEGFDIGEDVPIRRMDTPINYVLGNYKGSYIYSSTINGLTSGAVTIEFDEISNWTTANISVSVV